MARVVDLRKQGSSEPARSAQLPLPSEPRRSAPRRPLLRRRRARRRLIVGAAIVLLFVAAAFGISYASYLPALNIHTITVEGSNIVPAAEIQSFANSELNSGGHPFISPTISFLFHPAALEAAITAQFPRLASAQVTRDSIFATDLTITVSERQAYALWCESSDDPLFNSTQASSSTDTYDPAAAAGACYYMDQTGYVFAAASDGTSVAATDVVAASSTATSTISTSTPLAVPTQNALPQTSSGYIFSGALSAATSSATSTAATSTSQTTGPIGESFIPEHLPGIEALLSALGQSGFTPTGAQASSDGVDFTVPLQQGFYLKASFGEDPQTLAQNLQLVLSSSALQGQTNNLDYIDLRFGDKVYYELKGGANTAAQ